MHSSVKTPAELAKGDVIVGCDGRDWPKSATVIYASERCGIWDVEVVVDGEYKTRQSLRNAAYRIA